MPKNAKSLPLTQNLIKRETEIDPSLFIFSIDLGFYL